MKILQDHACFQNFPTDYRSLLKTPRSYVFRDVKPGQYFHFSLTTSLKNVIVNHSIGQRIELLINVDGLPISKSSGSQLWPILGLISGYHNINSFVIGVYHGYAKPDCPNDNFVSEMEQLEIKGIEHNDLKYIVSILGFCCDAPARSFISKTKTHTGYFCCSKCEIEGDWEGRLVLLDINVKLRSDESFRRRFQSEHHVGTSALEN